MPVSRPKSNLVALRFDGIMTTGGQPSKAEKLASVRAQIHVHADRLVSARNQSHATHESLEKSRVMELLENELKRTAPVLEPRPMESYPLRATGSENTISGSSLSVSQSAVAQGSRKSLNPRPMSSAELEKALSLVEKIEWMVRQAQPTLELQLGGTAQGKIELMKTGSKCVRIRLSQPHVLSELALERLQKELTARGVSLKMST